MRKKIRKMIKNYINNVSPIQVGSPESEEPFIDDTKYATDPFIKLEVFTHLQAIGSIDAQEEIDGDAWNELEVWEIPYNTNPNSREFKGSIIHNGKRYYGEY